MRTQADFEEAWDVAAPQRCGDRARKTLVRPGRYSFPDNVMGSKKKVTAWSGIAGQKIRVISPEQVELIKLLGGIPVTLGTSAMAAEDEQLTKKLAEGGMVVTQPAAAELAERAKAGRRITPYWKAWGEKRPAAQDTRRKVREAAGR